MTQKSKNDIAKKIKKFVLTIGAELYGIASAELYKKHFPKKPQPEKFLKNTQSIITIGLPFEPGTIATVLKPELSGLKTKASEKITRSKINPVGAERYFLQEENKVITHELTLMGYKIAKFLRSYGYNALHLPACKQNKRFKTAPFYHQPAMYLAGLGTMGLNCNIITPEFGPRFFVTSIITDAKLPSGKPMKKELCDNCMLCVENCPINAIDGKGGKNGFACASYGCCGICMAICPIGKI